MLNLWNIASIDNHKLSTLVTGQPDSQVNASILRSGQLEQSLYLAGGPWPTQIFLDSTQARRKGGAQGARAPSIFWEKRS